MRRAGTHASGGGDSQALRALGRNFVLDDRRGEAWSVYRLHPPETSFHAQGEPSTVAIRALDERLGSDFSLLRITRRWSSDEYAIGLEAIADIRHARRDVLRCSVRAQSRALERLGAYTADVMLTVLLGRPPRSRRGRGGQWMVEAEARVYERLLACVAATRANHGDLLRLLGRRRGGAGHRACLHLDVRARGSGGLVAPPVDRLSAALDGVDPPFDAAVTVSGDPDRPPAARVAISICVAGDDPAQLRRRVDRLARELDDARLSHQVRQEENLFRLHLPHATTPGRTAPRAPLGIDLGSFRLSRGAVGSHAGAYIGHTTSSPPRPVLLDPFEGARVGAASAVVLGGAAGAGKTLCLELIMYNALIAGAAVVDVDLAGGHALERLPDVRQRASVLELSAVKRYRGLLDPLRTAVGGLGEQLACDLLTSILPQPLPTGWHEQIADAICKVADRTAANCGDVVAELRSRGRDARAAAAAIDSCAGSGLALLGYGHGPHAVDDVPAEFTSLRLRNLRLDARGADPEEGRRVERTARAVARLVAAYAWSIAHTHRGRRCVLAIDDAAILLGDSRGRAVIEQLLVRAQADGVVIVIATRDAADAAWLSGRCGAAVCFSITDPRQIPGAAAILRVDSRRELVRRLLGADPGVAVLRDWRGRTAAIEVELADERLRAALGLNP